MMTAALLLAGGPQLQAAVSPWVSVGPDLIVDSPHPYNGRMMGIAVDPHDVSHWLGNSDTGGLWETRDAGGTWGPRSDALDSLFGGPVSFAPSDPSIAYAASTPYGAQHALLKQGGLLKSTDGGGHWQFVARAPFVDLSGQDNLFARALAVNSSNPQQLMACLSSGRGFSTMGGVFKSSDGGVTWSRKIPIPCADLQVLPNDFSRQYAGVGTVNVPSPVSALARSMDGGETWQQVPGPWNSQQAQVGEVIVGLSALNPDIAYVSINVIGQGRLLGFWMTQNAWAPQPTWTALSTVLIKDNFPGDSSFVSMVVDPSDSSIVYAGGGADTFRFSNGAWTWISRETHADLHDLAFAGKQLLVANDGGIFGSLDRGDNWVHHNAGLGTVQFYRGSVHPFDSNRLLGGSQDNGTEMRAPGPGGDPMTWHFIDGGDGYSTFFSPQHPDTHWAAISNNEVDRFDENGGPQIVSSSLVNDDVYAPAVMEVSPANEDLVLLAGPHLLKTTQFFSAPSLSVTWTHNDPPGLLNAGEIVTAIAFAPGDPSGSTYAFGTHLGRLFLTRNGGGSWQALAPAGALPQRSIRGLAFDPTNASVLLACFDQVAQGSEGQVYRSSNALSPSPSWTNLHGGTSAPHHAIVMDPLNHSAYYVGTDLGVYRSLDAGASWSAMGISDGIPGVIVNDLRTRSNGDIVAFTYGRGAYMLAAGPAGTATPTPSPSRSATPSATVTPSPVPTGVACNAPPSLDGAAGYTFAGNASSPSFTVQGGNGAGRLLLLRVLLDSTDLNSIQGISYGGLNLTRYYTAGVSTSSGGPMDFETWYLAAPPTGSHSLVLNWGNFVYHSYNLSAVFYKGVDPTAPLGLHQSNPAVNFAQGYAAAIHASAANSLITDFLVAGAWNSGASITLAPGQVLEFPKSSGGPCDIVASDKAAAPGLTSLQYQMSANSACCWSSQSLELLAAACTQASPTASPQASPSFTRSPSPTPSLTGTLTRTATPTASASATAGGQVSQTFSPSPTPTRSRTPASSPTRTASASATLTPSPASTCVISPSVDGAASYTFTGNGSDPNFAVLGGAGSQRLLLVRVLMDGAPGSIHSVSYGGAQLMRFYSSAVSTPQGMADLEAWYLVAPPTGSHSLAFHWGNFVYRNYNFSAVFYRDVRQDLPLGAQHSNAVLSSPGFYSSNIQLTASNSLISDFLVAGGWNSGATISIFPPQTQEYPRSAGGPADIFGDSEAAGGPGLYNLFYNISFNSACCWSSQTIEILGADCAAPSAGSLAVAGVEARTSSPKSPGQDAGPDALQAFPDPATDRLTLRVRLAEPAELELRVYDLSGRQLQLLQRSFDAGSHALPVDVKGLAPGIYLVHGVCQRGGGRTFIQTKFAVR